MVPIPSPWDGQCFPGILRKSALSVSWVPGARGVVGVIIRVSKHSIAPWVCCLGSPYVPHRGAWVLRFSCWGAVSLVAPCGIVSGQEVLLTQKVFVGGGTPNRERSLVKGMGGGRCANGCQIRADCRSLLLEAGDDIVCGEWGVGKVGSGESPSSKESQSLQMSADLLSIYECED